MKRLEAFVNEKLRVTTGRTVPDLIAIVEESKDRKEFKSGCQQLSEYLINDSGLPLADLEDDDNGFKRLSRTYKTGNDAFLWVFREFIFYGTWDDMYSVRWAKIHGTKPYINKMDGFKNFYCNDEEIIESKGVFTLTEDPEFMEQIDYLMQKA